MLRRHIRFCSCFFATNVWGRAIGTPLSGFFLDLLDLLGEFVLFEVASFLLDMILLERSKKGRLIRSMTKSK